MIAPSAVRFSAVQLPKRVRYGVGLGQIVLSRLPLPVVQVNVVIAEVMKPGGQHCERHLLHLIFSANIMQWVQARTCAILSTRPSRTPPKNVPSAKTSARRPHVMAVEKKVGAAELVSTYVFHPNGGRSAMPLLYPLTGGLRHTAHVAMTQTRHISEWAVCSELYLSQRRGDSVRCWTAQVGPTQCSLPLCLE